MSGHSGFRLMAEGLRGNASWKPAWREAAPKPAHGVVIVIVRGGGHGLATAFHLAPEHGIRSVAVLARVLVGQGNTGRNTTIVRANDLLTQDNAFHEHPLKLW